jgi:hypothetical protein
VTDRLDQKPPRVPPVSGRGSKNRIEANPAGAGGQMTTETTAIAGDAGEAEALISNDIGKGAPVYRSNGERIGRALSSPKCNSAA